MLTPATRRTTDSRAHSDGYTLIEMMAVVCVIGIVGAMAVMQISSARPGFVGDAGMRLIIGQLNYARDTAISQRRQVEITFPTNNSIQITRHDLPVPNTTVLATIPFESGLQFGIYGGTPDTPDAFGNTTATYFQGATNILFGTDGELVDNSGAPLNGTIFIIFPNIQQSFRAVTVMGSTGRVRGYRWNGRTWTEA